MFIDTNGTCFNRFGAWATLSDERKKHDIAPLTSALDTVSAIETIRFQYNDDAGYLTSPGMKMGFRAQSLEKVLPEWVQTTDDGTKVVIEQGATALTVAALRELRAEKDAQIAALKADVAAKDADLADLAARLARLERTLDAAANR
ncbi:MAG: tail fiber domain-containing protein [Planctomycetaceae bacterium]|nr:tail fiber domain-containing protein [Planctomycetaceae bacterium]